MNANNTNLSPETPFAKYTGILKLGNRDIDCYVLDTGERVISLRATVRSISSDDNGDLSKYIGVKALQPYIDDRILNDMVDFSIPGNPIRSKGITAETFLDICSAYVSALLPQILN